MAVNAIPVGCDLVLQVENDKGTGSITRKYPNVNPGVTDTDIYDVANGPNGLATLQIRNLVSVQRVNTYELENN